MARTPAYYEYYGSPFLLDTDPAGNWVGFRLNTETGEFEPDNRPVAEVLLATSSGEISPLDREEFIWQTERERGRLRGEGAVFALYETVDAIYARARAEGRRSIDDDELALVRSIRRRTFKMWEDEAARRAAGEPPSFTVARS
ncbi:hypothetical protein [Saccharothrix coeruleofusca]|uniref:Uncharacterized protein n=1 Tax=Saccharothrix coeruleofusca TaxID=33919 RepID=A0A918EFI0_9PSEU|nr:hypothetical protein [Saccharothrix coeruleofusca]MBP2337485.1 hypothetical protein [Saccharothrix coeruleofusca]GGP65468.1 hypothetical protein GCM10010185_42840 [Saccharothrix coeruleofusca]